MSAQDKRAQELQAMTEIVKLVPEWSAGEIMELWNEYEEARTEDAMIIKDLDKFDMIVQGLEYEQKFQKDLGEFFEGVGIFRTEIVRDGRRKCIESGIRIDRNYKFDCSC